MRDIVIIGLGNFGYYFALRLEDRAQVTAIDTDKYKIQTIGEKLHRAVVADATKIEVLRELGVDQAEVAVVSVGESLESSILITLHLKELGIPQIFAKAISDDHAEILRRVGATRVLQPEREVAENLAISVAQPTIVDYLQLHRDFGIIEIEAPESCHRHTLAELEFRAKYGLTVIGIFRNDDRLINPGPGSKIQPDDRLVLLGTKENISQFQKQLD